MSIERLSESLLATLTGTTESLNVIESHKQSLLSARAGISKDSLLAQFVHEFYSEQNIWSFIDRVGIPQWNYALYDDESLVPTGVIVPVSKDGEWVASLISFNQDSTYKLNEIDLVTRNHMDKPMRYLDGEISEGKFNQLRTYTLMHAAMQYALEGRIDSGYTELLAANNIGFSDLGGDLGGRCMRIRICVYYHVEPPPPPGPYVFRVPITKFPEIADELARALSPRGWKCFTVYDCSDPRMGEIDYGTNGPRRGGGGGNGPSAGSSTTTPTPKPPLACSHRLSLEGGGMGADPELSQNLIASLNAQAKADAADAFASCLGLDKSTGFGAYLLANPSLGARLQELNTSSEQREVVARKTFEAMQIDPLFYALTALQVLEEAAILRQMYDGKDGRELWSEAAIISSACWNVVGGSVHTILDLAGMVPGFGEPADLINAAVYAIEGDYTNATISVVATIPIIGMIGTGGRIVTKVAGLTRRFDGTFAPVVYHRVNDYIHFCTGANTSCRHELRKILGGMIGDGTQAHHIIPVKHLDYPVVQRLAAKARFHMNNLENGILIDAAKHRAGHPVYNTTVRRLLDEGQRLGLPDLYIVNELQQALRRHIASGKDIGLFTHTW